MKETGVLSIVATPIGNLEDITFRAIRTLKEADYILCEDTRVTGKLLKHYEINTKLKRYDAHTSGKAHEDILHDLEEGKHLALVSDAGTPGISDPGVMLVQKIKTNGYGGHPMSTMSVNASTKIKIEVIPGTSALTAAFSISGLSGNEFTFLGFVPQKKGRKTFFEKLAKFDKTVIFFESTHRIMKTLEALNEQNNAGTPVDWSITVARELTKLHEEVVSGTPEEVQQYFLEHVDHQRGEFVVMVSKGGQNLPSDRTNSDTRLK